MSFQDRFCLRRIFRSLSVVALSFPSRCRWRIRIRFGLLQSRRICQRHSREGRGGLGDRGTFSKSFLYFRFVSNPILFWTFELILFLSTLYCLVAFANRPLFQPVFVLSLGCFRPLLKGLRGFFVDASICELAFGIVNERFTEIGFESVPGCHSLRKEGRVIFDLVKPFVGVFDPSFDVGAVTSPHVCPLSSAHACMFSF